MTYNRKLSYELLKEFHEFCIENNIWYSADDHTLLGIFRHGGFVPWFEKIQVMMTPSSYRKLLRLNPTKLIDSSIIHGYKSLKACYVFDSKKWKDKLPFIEIRILVPTSIKNISKFKSPIKKITKKIIRRKDNLRHAVNDLYERKYEGYYLVTSRKAPAIDCWITNVTFRTEVKSFAGIDINVLEEAPKLINNWFGDNWLDAKVPNTILNFDYPGYESKEKL